MRQNIYAGHDSASTMWQTQKFVCKNTVAARQNLSFVTAVTQKRPIRCEVNIWYKPMLQNIAKPSLVVHMTRGNLSFSSSFFFTAEPPEKLSVFCAWLLLFDSGDSRQLASLAGDPSEKLLRGFSQHYRQDIVNRSVLIPLKGFPWDLWELKVISFSKKEHNNRWRIFGIWSSMGKYYAPTFSKCSSFTPFLKVFLLHN